ncbi:MAG: hypothetical protein AAF808_05035 [Cyanobacteria bacterium P01_D01_bin.2]
MRYWEFLIQQEGDQTWLPLEAKQVEILEGRYRMAAHTSHYETSVEVRVSQLLLDEVPPRRRVRKRRAMTNDSGLLAIFPFIQLAPGHWEIDCNSPDVMDDLLGEGWHYAVQLQVTPRDEDDWEPDWSEAAKVSYPAAAPEPASSTNSQDGGSSAMDLQLAQQAYVAQLGQTLTLAGHLSRNFGDTLVNHQLWIQLRDPQTASPLQETTFALPNQPLPFPFSVAVNLPDELSTQVILGAISLLDQEGTALASASFTVTIGLAKMLDAIANQPDLEFEEEISIFPGSTEAFIPAAKKSETLLVRDTPIVPRELIPSEGLTLPPQIKPASGPDRLPELPEFPKPAKADAVEAADATDSKPTTAQTPPLADPPVADTTDKGQRPTEPQPTEPQPTEPAEPTEPTEPPPFAEPNVFEIGSIEDDDLDLALATAALDDELQPSPAPESSPEIDSLQPEDTNQDPKTASIDRAFQKLHSRERFWQKLTLLTQDGYQQSLEMKRALDPITPSVETPASSQSQEFVAYEPPASPEQPGPEQPVPPIEIWAPTLQVPEQELVAGEWIAIRVRIPTGSYQPYVKVWMNDLQTRTLIDAPRLLMQFTPNDDGELETLMRVQIPDGCLELQFAAIAVDMTTLQESRKVVQNRRVMPPDESLSLFDDLNL